MNVFYFTLLYLFEVGGVKLLFKDSSGATMKNEQGQLREADNRSGSGITCGAGQGGKIDGWLYVAALWLLVNLVCVPYALYLFVATELRNSRLDGIYHFYLLMGIVVLVIGLMLTLATSWCFFTRRKGIREIIIPQFIYNVVYLFCLLWIPAGLFGIDIPARAIVDIGYAVAGIILGIPYFLFSKRINVVFCR
ncbi:DUF2569 domain-containing protein [Enterobacter sp. Cy-643]|nr:DUF2569 domain-containing protein [Enterobacter sp. Cy-643]